MQVSCSGLDWEKVRQRTSTQQLVDEMFHSEQVDFITRDFYDGIWYSDSATQQFEAAEALDEYIPTATGAIKQALEDVVNLFYGAKAIDDLGISSLTQGAYYCSASPDNVSKLLRSFKILTMDLDVFPDLNEASKEWILQWQSALEYLAARKLGLLAHCG